MLEADLPGFDKKDIKIDIDGGYLTINAERHSKSEEKDDKNNYIRCERSYGSFSRSFDVSAINTDAIAASYDNGVLKLTMPKKTPEVPTSRRLEIS
ncbi:18 kDa heat shock protein [bioreactor metagenome]|uniref:18 kDa heat shock protein n=1 Tax=bioreactor metagenome TaxID=1076179 RepID=A0A645J631_9ZZZZ